MCMKGKFTIFVMLDSRLCSDKIHFSIPSDLAQFPIGRKPMENNREQQGNLNVTLKKKIVKTRKSVLMDI